MKKIILFILFSFCVVNLRAQKDFKTYREAQDSVKNAFKAKNFLKALKHSESALLLAEKEFTKDSHYYATTLENIGLCAEKIQDLKKAEISYFEAKNIREKLLGKEHDGYLESCEKLAKFYFNQAKYSEAEALYKEIKTTREKVFGKEHNSYLESCEKLAKSYYEQAKYAEAEILYKEIKTTREKVFGKDNKDYAHACSNLAQVYKIQGKYTKTEPLMIEAKNIREKILGKEHIDYAFSCDDLAQLYTMEGKYSEAETLSIESKKIREKLFGKAHIHYAFSCNNLAYIYESQGKFNDAEALYQEGKYILKKILGGNHPSYATFCSNLAGLYTKQDKYTQAEALMIEAKKIQENLLGREHLAYATSCNTLAVIYENQKKYIEAEHLHLEALNIIKKVLTKEHINYATSCYNLANLYQNQGKYTQAEGFFLEANKYFIKQIEINFSHLSEREKGQFYNTFSNNFEIFTNFAARCYAQKLSIAEEVYNNTLATKALLFNASNKMRERILNSKDESLKKLFEEWKNIKENISKVYQMSIKDREKQGIDLTKLENEANELEKQLSQKSELFATTNDKKHYTWQDVQKKLKQGEVAIEIIRFDAYSKKWIDTTKYMVLLVKPDSQYPKMIILENGNDLEKKYLNYYRNAIKNKTDDKYSYNQYWQKINNSLKGVKKVYFSPDGVYNSINLLTLKNNTTQKYLRDEMEIELVTNTKDLVSPKPKQNKGEKSILIGYPDYNNELKNESDKNNERSLDISQLKKSQRFFNGQDITLLEGTKMEIQNISNLLKAQKIPYESFYKQEANEKLVKSIQSPTILHIATHGFFMPNIEKDSTDKQILGLDSKSVAENPLLRSGLLFANAKTALKDGGDGVLTSYEAMNLNLDNTEIVVLSACETGLGEVKNGEGVYGLQRAFQTAGAKAIVMSLWTVDDTVTQEMMALFYENWISQKQSKRTAFKNAQTEIKNKYPEPYYWGAFVMVGE